MALLDVSVGDSDTDDSNDVIDVDLLDSDGLISLDSVGCRMIGFHNEAILC